MQWFLSHRSVAYGQEKLLLAGCKAGYLSFKCVFNYTFERIIALLIREMAPVELGSLLSFPSSARAASISHTEKKTQF